MTKYKQKLPTHFQRRPAQKPAKLKDAPRQEKLATAEGRRIPLSHSPLKTYYQGRIVTTGMWLQWW